MKAIPLFSGLSAALGIYLYLSPSRAATNIIGLGIVFLGLASIVIYFNTSYKKKKSILNLQRQLTDFLEGRIKSPAFSVNDDDLSIFENAVIELETRLLLEQDNTKKTSKRNTDFIADISHQLKTPLTALKLFCEMDSSSSSNAHTAKQLELIAHMESLIYSLLRLEKLRSDAYEMNFHTCSILPIIREACEALIVFYPEKNITISGDAVLRCDAYWMGEAVLNIIKNACEHTRLNGGIRISIENFDASITLNFDDDGGGVAESEISKLFKRFSHVAAGPRASGAGLGLSIAKEIVQKHHGTIYAENSKCGLRIILSFPVLDGVLAI